MICHLADRVGNVSSTIDVQRTMAAIVCKDGNPCVAAKNFRPPYLYTQAIPAEIGACSGLAELYINNNQKVNRTDLTQKLRKLAEARRVEPSHLTP